MSVNVSPFRVAATAVLPPSIRAEGALALTARKSGVRNTVDRLSESGPLRMRFPRMTDGERLEGVLINTAGGIACGDRLRYEIGTAEDASLAITSQAAEKVYRSSGGVSLIEVKLSAGVNSRLAWLPQETILFDRVKLKRTLTAQIASSANVTICESVVFGRAAMGEKVTLGVFEDCWRIFRAGKLIFSDTVRLHGKIERHLSQRAVAAGDFCIATILQVAPGAETHASAARAALEGLEAGASAYEGMLVIRLLSPDSFTLRRAILNVLHAIGAPPPRAFTL